jgi:hypothetical protein
VNEVITSFCCTLSSSLYVLHNLLPAVSPCTKDTLALQFHSKCWLSSFTCFSTRETVPVHRTVIALHQSTYCHVNKQAYKTVPCIIPRHYTTSYLTICVTAGSAVLAAALAHSWFNILQLILHFYSPYLKKCWERCPSADRCHIRQTQPLSVKFYKFSKTTESN